MKPVRTLALLAASLAVATAAAAAPSLSVRGGWSRPAPAGGNGVGYLTIQNGGAQADTLVKVETPVADHVEMHSMSMAGGVMKMGPVASMPVPAGGKAEFAPGGYHLMLVSLKAPLKIGDKLPLTLAFASGAKLQATLSVGVMPPSM